MGTKNTATDVSTPTRPVTIHDHCPGRNGEANCRIWITVAITAPATAVHAFAACFGGVLSRAMVFSFLCCAAAPLVFTGDSPMTRQTVATTRSASDEIFGCVLMPVGAVSFLSVVVPAMPHPVEVVGTRRVISKVFKPVIAGVTVVVATHETIG